MTSTLADALVVKGGDAFLVTDRSGEIPRGNDCGLGLYYDDCRYLDGYELRIAGQRCEALMADAAGGSSAVIELTNPDLTLADGRSLGRQTLGVRWERVIDARTPALEEVLVVRNFGSEPVDVPLELRFDTHFDPLFAVRGVAPARRGRRRRPAWRQGALVFVYDGADDVQRRISVHSTPEPDHHAGRAARFRLQIEAGGEARVEVSLEIAESGEHRVDRPGRRRAADRERLAQEQRERADRTLADETEIRTDDELAARAFDRALRDLQLLRSEIAGETFYAAGVPWYVALFGRDSLISALETLAFEPDVAASTLRLLARYQGHRDDAWRDEEPGKIMHELRVGEMARTGQIPQTPYYGSVDSTPLFLVLLAEHARWTGDLSTFRSLQPEVDAALGWIDGRCARDDGWLSYATGSRRGLANQGWKDSGNAIVNADGSLATPPIALIEVQGYVHLAKRGLAALFERSGDRARAARLRAEADDFRGRVDAAFWQEELGVYALALQAGGAPAAVVSSNTGQALWGGIAGPERARAIGKRLLHDDMWSGWGVRTLSRSTRRYNPIGYHVGTVWPHDNALIAAGLRGAGLDDEALQVFQGLLDAASEFDHARLPEVFAGYARAESRVPVRYPVACHPQAWAAGALPFLVQSALGLEPDAFEQRLTIRRPQLPRVMRWLELRRLRVGEACIDLRFERRRDRVEPSVLGVDGTLDVDVRE